MKKLLRILVPLLLVSGASMVTYHLISTRPEPWRRSAPSVSTDVKAKRLKRQDHPVVLTTQGTVRPRTESTLIPQVSGRIVEVAPNFRNGGFFELDDLLLRIDPSDYKSAVIVAQATLAQAEATLQMQQAQSDQARENWVKLGQGGDPNPLVLRIPQLAEARASVASAEARLDQAERDLERTRILAPYAGRILKKQADLGQHVSPGTTLAAVYAVDYAEIRLPLSNQQLSFIAIPEQYRGDRQANPPQGPRVLLRGQVGNKEVTWEGRIVRAEGAIDTSSRQLFVVAQVDDPYGKKQAGKPPLKAGQFVQAEIQGNLLRDVFVLPRSAVRDGREVLIINDRNELHRRQIQIIWTTMESVVTSGKLLKEGEVLCLTSQPYAAEGASVIPTIAGEGRRIMEWQKPKGGPRSGRPGQGNSKGPPGTGRGGDKARGVSESLTSTGSRQPPARREGRPDGNRSPGTALGNAKPGPNRNPDNGTRASRSGRRGASVGEGQ